MRWLIALSILVLAGCGAGYVWDKPGVSAEQAKLDMYHCEQDGRQTQTESQTGIGRALERAIVASDCMEAHGYTRVPKT